MRTHPITGMTLEDGHGHLPDHQQALVLHLPYIELTKGETVAAEMRAQIMALMNPKQENVRAAGLPPLKVVEAEPKVEVDGKPAAK